MLRDSYRVSTKDTAATFTLKEGTLTLCSLIHGGKERAICSPVSPQAGGQALPLPWQ